MAEVKVKGDTDIGLNCKSCGEFTRLYKIRKQTHYANETVILNEPYEGAVKLDWKCPLCDKEDVYYISDFITLPPMD